MPIFNLLRWIFSTLLLLSLVGQAAYAQPISYEESLDKPDFAWEKGQVSLGLSNNDLHLTYGDNFWDHTNGYGISVRYLPAKYLAFEYDHHFISNITMGIDEKLSLGYTHIPARGEIKGLSAQLVFPLRRHRWKTQASCGFKTLRTDYVVTDERYFLNKDDPTHWWLNAFLLTMRIDFELYGEAQENAYGMGIQWSFDTFVGNRSVAISRKYPKENISQNLFETIVVLYYSRLFQ